MAKRTGRNFLITVVFLVLIQAITLAVDKEALWYRKLADNKVECVLCPFQCVLAPGQRGQCGVRINTQGTLYTLVYGRIAALHVDPIEKKPLFHFLPGSQSLSLATAGCNLHCKFCQNWDLSQSKPEDLDTQVLSPDELVALAKKEGCRSISYTYSEPTIFYELVLDTAKKAKQAGLYNVMVSAGYINEEPLRKLAKYIDAAHIDLKGFTEDYYQEVTSGSLAPVLRTLKILKQEGVWVEIVHLIVPTLNDNLDSIEAMCRWIKENLGADTPLHLSRFYPMYRLKDLPPTPVKTLEQARERALKAGLKFVYIGNVPGHPGEYTYCPKCGKILIKRTGYTIVENNIKEGTCIFCGERIPGKWE